MTLFTENSPNLAKFELLVIGFPVKILRKCSESESEMFSASINEDYYT